MRNTGYLFQAGSAIAILLVGLSFSGKAESSTIPVTRRPSAAEVTPTVPMEPGLSGSNSPSDTEATARANEAPAEGIQTDAVETTSAAATTVSAGSEASESPGGANTSISTGVTENPEAIAGTISVNYFALLFGPGLKNPTSYQPTISGDPDVNNLILIKNYLGVGYNVTNDIAVTPTAYWAYQPVRGQSLSMRDPYVVISDNNLYRNEYGSSWYGDLRFHFPITQASRDIDLRSGVQTFHYLSQEIQGTRVTFGTSLSFRANFYGKQGVGTDVELYAAPNVSYQISPKLSALLRYELNASHNLGDGFGHLNNDGTDLEPGVIWNITNSLMINPYLNLTPGGSVSLKSTSVGAYLNWTAI